MACKLPKSPKKGQVATITTDPRKGKHGKNLGKRRITFKATGKTGFGKWKIIKNEKVKK